MKRPEKCLLCATPLKGEPVCSRCAGDPFMMEEVRKRAAKAGLAGILEEIYKPDYAFLREGDVKKLWNDILVQEKDTTPEFTAWRNRVSVEMIPVRPGRVLEIGIGTGLATKHLSHRFPDAEIYGIDLSEQSVRNIASQFTGHFAVANIEDLPWSDVRFDAILMLEVLEHIEVPRTFRALRALRARLAKHGCLILSVPLETVEDLRLSYFVCPHCGQCVHRIGHVRSYSDLEPVRTELRLCGFQIEHMCGLAGGKYLGIPRQWLMHLNPDRIKPMVMIFRCRGTGP